MAKVRWSDFTILKVKIWRNSHQPNIAGPWKSAGGKKPVDGFCTPPTCLLVWEALGDLGNLLLLGEMNTKFSTWLPNNFKFSKFNLTVNCAYV